MNIVKILTDRISGKAPKGAKRSPKWRKLRKVFITQYPLCFVCRSKKKVEVHHKIPFHIAPDLELKAENLVSLCENKRFGICCHQLLGHLGNYRRINVSIEEDIFIWRKKLGQYDVP